MYTHAQTYSITRLGRDETHHSTEGKAHVVGAKVLREEEQADRRESLPVQVVGSLARRQAAVLILYRIPKLHMNAKIRRQRTSLNPLASFL